MTKIEVQPRKLEHISSMQNKENVIFIIKKWLNKGENDIIKILESNKVYYVFKFFLSRMFL